MRVNRGRVTGRARPPERSVRNYTGRAGFVGEDGASASGRLQTGKGKEAACDGAAFHHGAGRRRTRVDGSSEAALLLGVATVAVQVGWLVYHATDTLKISL